MSKRKRDEEDGVEGMTVTERSRKKRKVQKVNYALIEYKEMLTTGKEVLVWYNGYWSRGYYSGKVLGIRTDSDMNGKEDLFVTIDYPGGADCYVKLEEIYECGCKHPLNRKNQGKSLIADQNVYDPNEYFDDAVEDDDLDDNLKINLKKVAENSIQKRREKKERTARKKKRRKKKKKESSSPSFVTNKIVV